MNKEKHNRNIELNIGLLKLRKQRQKKEKIVDILVQAGLLIMFVISMTMLAFAFSLYQ